MRRIVWIVCLLLALTGSAAAADAGEISPQDGLPPEAVEQIGTYDGFSADGFSNALLHLLKDAASLLGGSRREGLSCCGMILAAVLLCGLLDGSEHASALSSTVGALAVTAAFTGGLSSMIRLGTQAVEKIDTYFLLLLPGIASLTAASGQTASSSALYLGTLFFMKVLMSVIRCFLVPGIYLYVMLAAAESALENDRLTKLRELIFWLISGTLKLSLYLFTGYLTVTGVIAGTADALRLKAAKVALSGAVPVVGGIISDASEALLTSAVTIKSAVGTYGLLAVLALCLYPFLRVAGQHLLMKGTTALCGLIGKKSHTSLVEHLTSAMGLTVGIVGTFSVMVLICITVFLKISV